MSIETLQIEPVEPVAPPARGPWGPFATIGITFLVLIAHLVASFLVAVAITTISMLRDDFTVFPEQPTFSGLSVSITTLLTCIATLALTTSFIVLRGGPTLREYLALRAPGLLRTIAWAAGFYVYLIAFDVATAGLRTEDLPQFMVDVYKTAGSLPLLIFALGVAAPLAEETLFRGFMFAGLRQSRLGATGAILVTSTLFAVLHIQYDLSGILIVFGVGLFLGYVRERTGSLPLCMILHGLMNVAALVQVASVVENG